MQCKKKPMKLAVDRGRGKKKGLKSCMQCLQENVGAVE